MLNAAILIFLLLLFVLVYMFIRTVMDVWIRQTQARFRLQYMQKATISARITAFLSRYSVIYRHLTDLLEMTASKLPLSYFLLISFVLFLTGSLIGFLFFRSIQGFLLLSIIFGSLMYGVLRIRLMNVQLKTRLDFLPAVEVFYQYYVLHSQPNIRSALQTAITENRITYPVKPVFEQLYRNLTTQRDLEDSLRIFVMTLGHIWADYFASILRVGLTEGIPISQPLKDLIQDMRKAQRSDQMERNRLLEIRIANFTPLLFLGIFLFVNFKMNYDNSYYFYLIDPIGKNMLLEAILLIFASFMMGVYLSIKRM